MPFLEPFEDGRRPAGRRRHVVAVLGHAQGHAVVEDHSVGLAHQPVPALADLQLLEAVRVDLAEEFPGVLPADLDLAERRGVLEADGFAHGLALAQHRRLHVLARLRVVPGPFPLPDVFELGTVGDVPGMDRGDPGRVEEFALAPSGQRRKGHRCEGGAEGRVPDLTEIVGLPQHRGDRADRVDR